METTNSVDQLYRVIAKNLKKARLNAEIERDQVPGFSERTIYRYENDEPPRNLGKLLALGQAYGVPYTFFFLTDADKLLIAKEVLMSREGDLIQRAYRRYVEDLLGG